MTNIFLTKTTFLKDINSFPSNEFNLIGFKNFSSIKNLMRQKTYFVRKAVTKGAE